MHGAGQGAIPTVKRLHKAPAPPPLWHHKLAHNIDVPCCYLHPHCRVLSALQGFAPPAAFGTSEHSAQSHTLLHRRLSLRSQMTAAALVAVADVASGEEKDAVVVRSLGFAFPFSQTSVIRDLDLQLPRGSRCLLTGANGAGELPPPARGGRRRAEGGVYCRCLAFPRFAFSVQYCPACQHVYFPGTHEAVNPMALLSSAPACFPSAATPLGMGACPAAGKTTLLQVLAGKYMVGQDTVRILGRPAFHDISLVSSSLFFV